MAAQGENAIVLAPSNLLNVDFNKIRHIISPEPTHVEKKSNPMLPMPKW